MPATSRRMPATRRQKACIACAESKRRCDKQFPECQRCLDRDVDCAYPQPKRRRRNPTAPASRAEEPPAIPIDADADADANPLGGGLGFGDWGVVEAVDLDPALPEVIMPGIPTLPPPADSLQSQGVALENGDVSSIPCPWFLQADTWHMRHCNEDPACVAAVELEPFIRDVEEMLKCWARNGHNSFIHQRLYEKGMPACLQDAFMTLSAYVGRTPAVKETILQIAEERSSALACQNIPATGGAQGILAQLARVQALFVYVFIALFDGSVRPRAAAEQQLPTLRRWAIRLLETVRRYRGQDTLGHRPLQWTASEFDVEYEAASEMWQLWVLTESVRRSHLIINTIINVYETITKGWADCTGAVMFTARRGLWEAESAVKWFELCCAKPPLLVPSLRPGPLISQYAAEEFDDFAKLFWSFIVGTDKMKCWVDRGTKTSITQPVL